MKTAGDNTIIRLLLSIGLITIASEEAVKH